MDMDEVYKKIIEGEGIGGAVEFPSTNPLLGDDDLDELKRTYELSLECFWLLSESLGHKLEPVINEEGYFKHFKLIEIREEISKSKGVDIEKIFQHLLVFLTLYESSVETALLTGLGSSTNYILKHEEKNLSIAKDLIAEKLKKAVRSSKAKKAINIRHDKKGGSRDKRNQIREIWATGKYTTKTRCAEEEYDALGMSFSTAIKALQNAPKP